MGLHPEGVWNPGSTSGEWSPGGCGCGSGGSCGCKGAGGQCDSKSMGDSGAAPPLPDYSGEIWAGMSALAYQHGRCETSQCAGSESDPWGSMSVQDPKPSKPPDPVYLYDDCLEKCKEWTRLEDFDKCMCCCFSDGQKKVPGGWLDALPPCPCTVPVGGADVPDKIKVQHNGEPVTFQLSKIGLVTGKFHPGATWELRQELSKSGPGQQCTYDKDGNLITGGESAGTPDIFSPTGPSGGGLFGDYHTPFKDHVREDVQTFTHCKRAGMINCYLCHRPPNNGNKCKENVLPPGTADQPAAKPDCDECKKKCSDDKVK